MKKYVYLLVLAMILAFTVLLGDMYNFLTNNLAKVLLMSLAGLCLVAYLFIKYKNRKKK